VIVVAEPLCRGIEHSPVNAAMLQICRLAFPQQHIRFCADAQHLQEVNKLIDEQSRRLIEWSPVLVPPRHAEFGRRFPAELRVLRTVLNGMSHADSHLLLLSAVESTIYSVKLLHALRLSKVPVQAVLHGYLAEIAGWRSRNPLVRALDLRSALSFGPDGRLRYVVLEATIAKRVIELLPRLSGNVQWLPHPIPADGGEEPLVPPLPLNVSFLGLATTQKGFDVFVKTAKLVADRCPGRVLFHAIGRAPRGGSTIDVRALDTAPSPQGLSRDEYATGVRRAHYICLPYQGTHYELSASGVLLDAIAWCKPIIGMPSPAVQELFADYPDIGYLCRTPEELVDVVAWLANHFDEQTYRRQTGAMSDVRRSRLPETIALRYRDITNAFIT